MPSAEGRGRARAAWDAYVRANRRYVQPAIEKTPLGDGIRSVSVNTVSDLLGFWCMWHLYGGFEGLQGLGMSRSSIFRKVGLFRKTFGKHPDEMEFPGIAIDVDVYFGQSGEPAERNAD
jgi:hypothetical protein